MSLGAENDQAISELVEGETDLQESSAFGQPIRDARAVPRFPFRGRATALVFDPEATKEPEESEVLTTDVSRVGLSLLHRKQLYPGQQILLVLNGASRLVEVRWCCRVWPGLYSVGCKFLNAEEEQPNTDGRS